jgi:hypothetical protein
MPRAARNPEARQSFNIIDHHRAAKDRGSLEQQPRLRHPLAFAAKGASLFATNKRRRFVNDQVYSCPEPKTLLPM